MLKGKTALVTGSTSGIGLGIAMRLAAQGANIMLNGFGDHAGPKAQVEALGVKVGYHGADMSKPAEIEAMVRAAEAEFGRWIFSKGVRLRGLVIRRACERLMFAGCMLLMRGFPDWRAWVLAGISFAVYMLTKWHPLWMIAFGALA